MKDTKSGPKGPGDLRAARLRAALRENLKRRKAQAKAKADIKAEVQTGVSADNAFDREDAGPVGSALEVPGTPNFAGFAPDKGKG